jgi:hypothetical protein
MLDAVTPEGVSWDVARQLIGPNGYAPLTAVLLVFNLSASDSFVGTLDSEPGFIRKELKGGASNTYISREGLMWVTLVLPLQNDLQRSLERFNTRFFAIGDNDQKKNLAPRVVSHLKSIIDTNLDKFPEWWVLVFAQVCGWFATGFGLLMTQMPDKNSMMVTGLACSVLQIAHFWLLGEEGALWGQLVMLLMCIFGFFEQHRWASVGYWFLYPLTLLGARHLHGWRDLEYLPLLGSFLSVFARHQRDLFTLRLTMVFANLPWLPYCIATKDWANLVGMSLFAGLSAVAFFRFHVCLSRQKRGVLGAVKRL